MAPWQQPYGWRKVAVVETLTHTSTTVEWCSEREREREGVHSFVSFAHALRQSRM